MGIMAVARGHGGNNCGALWQATASSQSGTMNLVVLNMKS